MRVQPGDDANNTQGKGILNLQPMWVQGAVCGLLAQNVGSLAAIVGSSLGLLARNVGSWPNGIKLGRTHDLFHGASEILGFFKHLLYVWASKPLWSRR